MKNYRIIIFCFLFLSCNSDKNSIVGKWKIISLQSARGNELKEGDYLYTYEFRNDGIYRSHYENEVYVGNWTLDSENKTIEFDEGMKMVKGNYQLNSNVLSLEVKKFIAETYDPMFGTIFIELEKIK